MREILSNRVKLAVPAMAVLAGVATLANADHVYDLDVTGIVSYNGIGDPFNTRLQIDLATELGFASGTEVTVTGIGWDVTLTAGLGGSGSWLSEMSVWMSDQPYNTQNEFAAVIPASLDDEFSGTESYSSPILLLSGSHAGISGDPQITLPNGILYLEFFEDFVDVSNAPDGVWNSGFLNIQAVPTPSTLVLLGLGGVATMRHRR